MGLLITESTLVPELGINLSGFVLSFRGSYQLFKHQNVNAYTILASYCIWLNQDSYNAKGQPIVREIRKHLDSALYPSNPLQLLYDDLKLTYPNATDILE
jgi:hypothetical protein